MLLERLLLSLAGEPFRTLSKLQRRLLRSPFGFQNCTRMTKYEALEKNVVSNRKLPSLRQSLVRSVTQKVSVCWGFWGWSTVIDSRLPSRWRRDWEHKPRQSPLFHRVCVEEATPGVGAGFDLDLLARPASARARLCLGGSGPVFGSLSLAARCAAWAMSCP